MSVGRRDVLQSIGSFAALPLAASALTPDSVLAAALMANDW